MLSLAFCPLSQMFLSFCDLVSVPVRSLALATQPLCIFITLQRHFWEPCPFHSHPCLCIPGDSTDQSGHSSSKPLVSLELRHPCSRSDGFLKPCLMENLTVFLFYILHRGGVPVREETKNIFLPLHVFL